MSLLDTIRLELQKKHPDLRFTEENGMLSVDAPVPGGFGVWVTDSLIVGYDGWHKHCQTEDESLAYFASGFSDQCRLKVSFRGSSPHMWTLQTLQDGRWVKHSTTGLPFFPFWRTKRIEYRQNALLKGG
jgi:hypothetical protein